MIPIILAASLWSLLFMATADWVVFCHALGPMGWLDALRGKAGVSVLLAVNHTVGQGAYGVWVARRTKSDVSTTVGVVALIVLTDLLALFTIVTIAVWVADDHSMPRQVELRWLAPAAVVGLIAGALAGPRLMPKLKLLAPWSKVSPVVFLKITALRISALAGVMFGLWAAAQAFGLDVPLAVFLALLPIIFLAAALPINVLGFGAVQLVWVAAFESWASGPKILAYQFLSQAMAVAAFILRGAPFLSSVLRDIAPIEDQPEDAPDDA